MQRHHLSSAPRCCPPRSRPARPIGAIGWARGQPVLELAQRHPDHRLDPRGLVARRAHLPVVRACGLERELAAANAGRSSPSAGARATSGACFAVIRERWKQFLFGFYPSTPLLAPDPRLRADARGAGPDALLRGAAQAALVLARLPRRRLLAALGRLDLACRWRSTPASPSATSSTALVAPRFGSLAAMIAAVLAALLWWLYLAGPVGRRPRRRAAVPVARRRSPPSSSAASCCRSSSA